MQIIGIGKKDAAKILADPSSFGKCFQIFDLENIEFQEPQEAEVGIFTDEKTSKKTSKKGLTKNAKGGII